MKIFDSIEKLSRKMIKRMRVILRERNILFSWILMVGKDRRYF